MSEELKYKDGEDLIIKAKVIHDLSDNPCDYRLVISGIYGNYVSEKELEDIVVETPQKPKVTQEVMDWYKGNKTRIEGVDLVDFWGGAVEVTYNSELGDWLFVEESKLKNQHALATLITYGPEYVEVEEEKRYKVKIKHLMTSDRKEQFLSKVITRKEFFASRPRSSLKQEFTKQELIDAGFGDVFDNPMFEIEEVE